MKHLWCTFFVLSLCVTSLSANEIDKFFPAIESSDSSICSDATFIRRTYLTLTGRLPMPDKVVSFIKSTSPQKREKLVDELLNSDEYIRYMLMHLGDILRIKSEFPSNLWPNGVQAYNRWLYERLTANMSYDQMIRELLLSVGSNFREPAVNFYRAFIKRSPEAVYKNINLLFLGERNCTDDGYQCFGQVSYKNTKEWKEEVVYIDIHKPSQVSKISLQDGTTLTLENGKDWRIPYVNWLTSKDNRRFGAVMANRIWYWMMGKGIVQEPDDWRDDNPASNKPLLDYLTDFFVEHHFDMKALIRCILLSNHYQNKWMPEGSYEARRLPAEVIVDALSDLTGHFETYVSRVPEPFTFYPANTRAVDLGDATVSSSELELFGKVSRDVSLESQRNNQITGKQLLYLMNSSELEGHIRQSKRLNVLCKQYHTVADICNGVTLMTLARPATAQEINLFGDYAKKNHSSLRDLATDIMWVQINSNEFLYNH